VFTSVGKLVDPSQSAIQISNLKYNYSVKPQVDTITVTAGNLKKVVIATKEAHDTILGVSDSLLSFSAYKGEQNDTILSNVKWTVQNKASWVTIAVPDTTCMAGLCSYYMKITVDSNKTPTSRVDTLFVVSGTHRDTIIVRQKAVPAISGVRTTRS
jgi:hypothetical protein